MEQTTPNPENNQPKSGNNGKIIATVIAAVVILAIVGIVFAKKEKTEVKSDSLTARMMNSEKNTVEPMSLKDLMTAGKTQKCIFSASSDSGSNQGSVYFDNGKMRGDFTATVNGKAVGSHMINDGTYMYTWSDEQKAGAKISIDSMAKMQANMPAPTGHAMVKAGVDQNAKYSYNCSSWSADTAQFSAPADINFIDASAMMGQMNVKIQANGQMSANGSAGVNSAQCSACDQAGAGKAQCLAALHCN